MESKKQFIEIINKLRKDKFDYLNLLFANCPEYVIHSMQHVKINKGHMIIQGGVPCDAVFIIVKGRASGMDFQPLGKVYMFMEYVSTDVLGDFELFGDIRNYRITVRAVTDCEIIRIPAAVYLDWMQQDISALFMRTRKLMNMFTNEAAEKRKNLFLNCKERLALYLVESYEKRAKDSGLKVNKTQGELADRIGFNIRTLQRNIQSLEKEEMISTQNGKIVISREQYLKLKKYVKDYLE